MSTASPLRKPSKWAWSYSRYKNFDTCPKRHYEVDLARNYKDEGEALIWGNEVHEALADATTGKAPLPPAMAEFQRWVDEIKGGEGDLYVEEKFAITREFQPTYWQSNNVWFRGICDVLRISPTKKTALARDYKTGNVKHDSRQLMLMAQCIFVYYPTVQRIKTEFVWLKDDCTSTEIFDRHSIANEWAPLLPLVAQMEEASRTMNYPPKPSGLCRAYCPVVSCSFHGKQYRS